MSTKIFNAYKLNVDLFTFNRKMTEYKNLRHNLVIGYSVADAIVKTFLDMPYAENELFNQTVEKNYEILLKDFAEFSKENMRIWLGEGYDSEVLAKYELNYVLYPYKNEAFIQVFGNVDSINHFIDYFNEYLIDYSYWNNVDAPNDVSEEEWQERREVWDEIFSKTCIPKYAGICDTLPFPQESYILTKYYYKRLSKTEKEKIIKYIKTYCHLFTKRKIIEDICEIHRNEFIEYKENYSLTELMNANDKCINKYQDLIDMRLQKREKDGNIDKKLELLDMLSF